MKNEIHWAIVGDFGLYHGTASTRKQAIAQHVWAYDAELFDDGRVPIQTHALSDLQKSVWRACRARGDRAVKVRIEIVQ